MVLGSSDANRMKLRPREAKWLAQDHTALSHKVRFHSDPCDLEPVALAAHLPLTMTISQLLLAWQGQQRATLLTLMNLRCLKCLTATISLCSQPFLGSVSDPVSQMRTLRLQEALSLAQGDPPELGSEPRTGSVQQPALSKY